MKKLITAREQFGNLYSKEIVNGARLRFEKGEALKAKDLETYREKSIELYKNQYARNLLAHLILNKEYHKSELHFIENGEDQLLVIMD